jgi:hypothetical protein
VSLSIAGNIRGRGEENVKVYVQRRNRGGDDAVEVEYFVTAINLLVSCRRDPRYPLYNIFNCFVDTYTFRSTRMNGRPQTERQGECRRYVGLWYIQSMSGPMTAAQLLCIVLVEYLFWARPRQEPCSSASPTRTRPEPSNNDVPIAADWSPQTPVLGLVDHIFKNIRFAPRWSPQPKK